MKNIRNWLAASGVLFILVSSVLGLAWSNYWKATRGQVPKVEEMTLWNMLQSIVPITPEQVLGLSLIGLLIGAALTIPWWRNRLRREKLWWEERAEPLDTPPRIS